MKEMNVNGNAVNGSEETLPWHDIPTEPVHDSVERRERNNFVMIPRMALRDLDPYELAVFANMKDAAGEEGYCNKSNETIASEVGIGVTKVKEVRKSLDAKGYVALERRTDPETGIENQTVVVRIPWLWDLNNERFSKREGGRVATTPQSQGNPLGVAGRPQIRTNEKEQKKKKKTPSADAEEGDLPLAGRKTPAGSVQTDNQVDLGEYNGLEEAIRDAFQSRKNTISKQARKKLRQEVTVSLDGKTTKVLQSPSDLFANKPMFREFVQRQLTFWKKQNELQDRSLMHPAIQSIVDYSGDYGWLIFEKAAMTSGKPPSISYSERPPDDQIPWEPEW